MFLRRSYLITLFLPVLLMLLKQIKGNTKVWTYNTDITDPSNWINNDNATNCDGLIFAESSTANIFINQLSVQQIVLPKSGSIILQEGANIEFNAKSKDKMNCVRLKPLDKKSWYDVTAWRNLNVTDNPAVPYSERIPCRNDDVVFPKGINSGVRLPGVRLPRFKIKIKSFKFENQYLDSDKLLQFYFTGIGSQVFSRTYPINRWMIYYPRMYHPFELVPSVCADPSGCYCGVNEYFCYVPESINKEVQCKNAIVPWGNCGRVICGSIIMINSIRPGFHLDKITQKLKEFRSYTYASKLPNNSIQIIFTEKEFNGESLIEGKHFYDFLLTDDSYYNTTGILFKVSGLPLTESTVQTINALSIIFGSLLGVLMMYALMFVIFSRSVGNLNIRNRLLSARPFSTYLFARYDNIEDRGYIYDGHSTRGSVISLRRSFENPMYDLPSSRSTSNETINTRVEDDKDKTVSSKDKTNEKIEELGSNGKLEEVPLSDKNGEDVLLKDL